MKIEIVSESDIEELNDLLNISFRGKEAAEKGWTHDVGLIEGERSTTGAVRKQMQDPNATIFKCVDEPTGKIIAMSMGLRRGDKMYAGLLATLPRLQGQGLGKKMMDVVEDHARKLNCIALTIEVVPQKKALVEWYERHGYRHTGNTSPFLEIYGNPKVPMVLVEMEKPLVY